MSVFAIQQSNRHPPMPIRKDVVWRCGNATSDAITRQEIASVRSNTKCVYHLSDVIARSNSKNLKLGANQFFKSP